MEDIYITRKGMPKLIMHPLVSDHWAMGTSQSQAFFQDLLTLSLS